MKGLSLAFLMTVSLIGQTHATLIFDRGADWRWRPGTSEASTPVTAWREVAFNDSQFTTAPSPFWYGDVFPGGTEITGMRSNYLCLFFRKTFVVSNVNEIGGLRLGAIVDDGLVAWINGTEVQRISMNEPAGSPVNTNTLAANAVEPVAFLYYDLPSPTYLVPGTNVIAVQVFQSSLESSDIGFDASLEAIITETIPPVVADVTPAPGATVTNLVQMTVAFSEPVSGVSAADLLVNGVGTTMVLPVSSSVYTFSFPQPAYGTVQITWAAGHGITDQALPPNPFNGTGPGETWQYNLVDNTAPVVASLTPSAGATVRTLTSINVLFSESVQGVNAADLQINGTAAAGVTQVTPSQYTFSFPEPPTGVVQVAWATGHGIRDLAPTPNAFAGGSWTYRLDPNASDLPPYISEIMASNQRTLTDENGDYSDWIEIYNPSAVSVNLDGWTLLDSSDEWRFPATNLVGGGFLVVFASGKNRAIPGARLHTNFRLAADGEYLALAKPDGTVVSEFNPFDQQVPDVSYGYAQFGDGPLYTAGTNVVYFTRPTPSAPNVGGTNAPGPAILNVKHSPNIPMDNDDLLVTAQVFPSFYTVASVSMIYRVMFSNEVTLPMFDDGAHGDGAAGDGVYAATIPASASTNGQMIRYYISATDVNSRPSRWPTFLTATNHAEYLGTVVNPYYVTSTIPVIHLFALPTVLQPGPNTSAIGADSQTGSNGVAVFYDGEFYDRVHVSLRGNTTAGYPKKSHRFEFNREHPFRHPGVGFGWPEQEGPRIRRTSFVADYPDPTYMRQGMAFWLCEQIGSPGSFYYPVRLQLNGQFYQLANHNDVQTEELLDRLGYDPNGALYNAAGTVQPSQFSTGGFEKKSREWEGNADYLQLANAVAETLSVATRRTNIFDMLDLPNVINYLVAARFVQENDDVWANMSLYHDNDGDNLWRIIGFDMNLSWGAFYFDNAANDGGIQATNDNHKSFPLYGSSQALSLTSGNYNRIYDVIFDVPQTLEMFQRRMQTMLDTYVLPPGSPTNASPIEQKLIAWRDLIMAEGATDRAKWQWPAIGGQNNLPPGTNVFFGVKDLLEKFFYLRRNHFYGKHSVANTSLPIGTGKAQNAGFPLSQPANAYVSITGVDYNPSSGNQDHEFIALTNPAPFAIDISGWKLEGAIDFTFAPGTVIPSTSAFYVSPNVRAFRSRTVSPRGGEGRFVLGPYSGQLSARGETVRVRNGFGNIVNTFPFAGAPTLAQQYLRVTEIMYHPPAVFGDSNPQDEYEYVELKNISTTTTLNLDGVRFTNGIAFNFTGSAITTLAPGARVLVVKNVAAFPQRYGGGLPVAGQFTGTLDNGGERIRLIDATGEEILDFDYEDDWYPITDGLGFSLVVVNENAEPDLWDSKTNWRASSNSNGSPGNNDPTPPAFAAVLITEALSRTDNPPPTDSIEIHNPTAQPANIGGWWLSDDFNTPQKYRLTNGTVIPAGGYLVLDESQFNTAGGFALSSDGDEVWLFSADAPGNLTGYVHGHRFGAADNGVSFGRYVTSVGEEHFVAQTFRTLGAANAGPRVGPVVINEIMYHPPDTAGTNDNSADEFVELLNITDSPVQLFDSSPTNTWRITGGIDFVFPANLTLAPDEYVLLVNFNPANSADLAAFRSRYRVPVVIRVFGPYDGKLDNSDDEIELKKPTTPVGNNIPYVLVDKVEYSDEFPWPAGADGSGLSLQRRLKDGYGNDPINWTAAPSSAAAATSAGGTAPVITVQPQGRTVLAGTNITLSVSATGTLPLGYQWRLNGVNLSSGTNSLLQLLNIEGNQAGDYDVVVFNSTGSAVSSNATLNVMLPASILQQPGNINTNPGANVTFRIIAYSPSPLRYQWQKNGLDLQNQTNAILNLTAVQIEDEGAYSVLVTDEIGTIRSAPAELRMLIGPFIIYHPVSQSVVPGSTVTLSWSVTNGATLPIAYRWRINNVFVGNYTSINSRVGFLTIPNAQPPATNYQVAITNILGSRLSNAGILNFVTDSDGDGIPDEWEAAYNFNTNNTADAFVDTDGDTMLNREEYIAGTNPRDPLSYLKAQTVNAPPPAVANVEFVAVSNRTYTIEYIDDLTTGSWQRFADVAASPTNRVATVQDRNPVPGRFYRLATPRQE
jgi:hypothetical protein